MSRLQSKGEWFIVGTLIVLLLSTPLFLVIVNTKTNTAVGEDINSVAWVGENERAYASCALSYLQSEENASEVFANIYDVAKILDKSKLTSTQLLCFCENRSFEQNFSKFLVFDGTGNSLNLVIYSGNNSVLAQIQNLEMKPIITFSNNSEVKIKIYENSEEKVCVKYKRETDLFCGCIFILRDIQNMTSSIMKTDDLEWCEE